MAEYFIRANSNAAPFFSDSSTGFQIGSDPTDALNRFAARYDHPCGLYAAGCYSSADAYHKGEDPLARWLNNRAAFVEKHSKAGAVSFLVEADRAKIDDVWYDIESPREGRVVSA